MALSAKDLQLWHVFTSQVAPLKATHRLPQSIPVAVTRVNPSTTSARHTLDLHGMTLQQAYQAVVDHVQQGISSYAYVTIITGKSGIMHAQLPDWLSHMHIVKSCEVINGGGAYKISFKKTRQPIK